MNLAGGVTLAIFEEEMQPALEAAAGSESLATMGEALANIWQLAKQTVETVNQEADTVARLSSATPFLGCLRARRHRLVVATSGADR